MLKNLSQLEHKVGDRIFHLLCDPNSPLNEVREALYSFLKYVDVVEEMAKKSQEQPVEKVNNEQ